MFWHAPDFDARMCSDDDLFFVLSRASITEQIRPVVQVIVFESVFQKHPLHKNM